MTSREIFQKNKDASAWLSSVVNDPRYDQVEMALQADICKFDNIDEIHGAMRILESLRTIAIADPPAVPTPKSGVIHDEPKARR